MIASNKPCYKANLHTHTTNSDGKRSPDEAMRMYRQAGYDILALTDHRKLTETTNVPDGLLMLNGTEIDLTLGHQAIHLLGIGIEEDVFAKYGRGACAQDTIDQIRSCGGRAVLAHPAWSLNTPEFMVSLKDVTASEVWNSVSTVPYNPCRADSSSLLDVTSALGSCIPFFASDDCHHYGYDFAQGTTMIQAEELSVPAVLDALDHKRFYATRGPQFHEITFDGEALHVRCTPASYIVFYSNLPWAAGRAFSAGGQTEATWKLLPGETFIRCQIIDQFGRSAWTNPYPVPVR